MLVDGGLGVHAFGRANVSERGIVGRVAEPGRGGMRTRIIADEVQVVPR